MGEALITRAGSGIDDNYLNNRLSIVNDYINSKFNIMNNSINNIAGSNGNTLFTSNGMFNPPKTGNYAVIAIGGGGGGGGSHSYTTMQGSSYSYKGGGGASGFINQKTVYLQKGIIVQINIGIGGNAGIGGYSESDYGTNGNTGGTTTFGSYLSANGGGGGIRAMHGNGFASSYGAFPGSENVGGHGINPPDLSSGIQGAGGSGEMNGWNGCVWVAW